MRALLLVPLALAAFAGCDHSSSGSATSAASASASAAASGSAPAASASASSAAADSNATAPAGEGGSSYGLGDPPKLPDADVATLEAGLKCTPALAGKPGPCKILAAMGKCGDWNPVAASGDGRYLGHGWQVTGTQTIAVVSVLRAKTVPQADVKPWQLPVKVYDDQIGKDAGAAFAQADKAIALLAKHEPAPAKNAAIDFLKAKADWKADSPAAKTMGSMIELFSERPTYACLGPAKQIVLVAQGASDVGVKSDGLYAELWPIF